MNWIYLILAGLCEIGWPLGLKLSQTNQNKLFWIVVAALSMGLSGVFLWIAQKTILMGTAYAVWTGISATGAFITLRSLKFYCILTDKINDREMFMKGVDYSYYYEQENEIYISQK
jgi:multidrug transporter EmrE-like cation transporter